MPEVPMTPMQRVLRQWESPPTWLLLFVGLAWLQARYWPIWGTGRVGNWLGAAMILGGLVLMVASLRQFRIARTTVIPREVPRVLITGGVYQLSRNPIYLADALILAGLALRWDLAGLILVAAFVGVIERRFILGEEAGLRAGFGPDYDSWAKKVRRWV